MKDELITVYEDRQTWLQLDDREKQNILSLKDLWGSQNIILQADGTLLMKHYVGFVCRNGTRIQIIPKVFADGAVGVGEETEKSKSIALLLRLLNYSGFLDVKELPEPMFIEAYRNDLFEVFISIFVSRFNRLINREIHRSYQTYEENMQFIKGKILFGRSIKENKFRQHLHFVSYEELTMNNLLNRIIKTIIIRLLNQTQSVYNKKSLKYALIHLREVDVIKLYPGIFDEVRFNRLNDSYRPLFNMARMFYYNRQPGQTEGDEFTFTFLVPINRLFEHYVYKLLENSALFNNSQYLVQHHKPHKYLAHLNGHKVFKLEPDITISQSGKVKIILDAKYKNPMRNTVLSVLQSDVYQVLAYAVAFDCQLIYLVYPAFVNNENDDIELATYEIEASNGRVFLKVVQLNIVNAEPIDVQKSLEKILGNQMTIAI